VVGAQFGEALEGERGRDGADPDEDDPVFVGVDGAQLVVDEEVGDEKAFAQLGGRHSPDFGRAGGIADLHGDSLRFTAPKWNLVPF